MNEIRVDKRDLLPIHAFRGSLRILRQETTETVNEDDRTMYFLFILFLQQLKQTEINFQIYYETTY